MDEVTKDMRNETSKQFPQIKLMIVRCTADGIDLNSSISLGVAYYFKFFFACLSTLGTQRRVRFKYLAPWLKSLIFQFLR